MKKIERTNFKSPFKIFGDYRIIYIDSKVKKNSVNVTKGMKLLSMSFSEQKIVVLLQLHQIDNCQQYKILHQQKMLIKYLKMYYNPKINSSLDSNFKTKNHLNI